MAPVMVVPMMVAPVVMAPVAVVPAVMPVPVMPADLFGLETIDFVLRHDRGLRAGARQDQVLFR
jgi:hypothetical protein